MEYVQQTTDDRVILLGWAAHTDEQQQQTTPIHQTNPDDSHVSCSIITLDRTMIILHFLAIIIHYR
jgi:hypothetical protein